MDLDQLKRFVVAAERGSLTAAARDLNITQSALTQSMKALEHTLGGALFDRGARGIRLTPLGEALIARAKSVVNEVGRIRNEALALGNLRAARVAIGVGPYLTNNLFPRVLERFLAAAPDTAVTVLEAESIEIGRALREGQIELGFCGLNPAVAADKTLAFQRALTLRYAVMARSGHPVLRRRGATDRDLPEFPWVVHDHETVERRIKAYFTEHGTQGPTRLVRANSLAVIRALVLTTDCIAVLPMDYAATDLARGDAKVLPFSGFKVEAEAGLLTRRDVPLSPAARRLMTEITRACRAAGRRAE